MAVVSNTEIEFSNVCDHLDDLATQILNVMQNIIVERQYLDDNLRDGFIKMAKARYLMPGQKVGMLQINTSNLQASKKVLSNNDSINGIKFTSFNTLDMKITNEPSSSVSHLEANSFSTENSMTDDSVKNINSEFEEDVSATKKESTVENPLRWFGVLVPDSLKICLSRFEQVIETSVKVVSLQNQLKALCEEYRIYRKKKSTLS